MADLDCPSTREVCGTMAVHHIPQVRTVLSIDDEVLTFESGQP